MPLTSVASSDSLKRSSSPPTSFMTSALPSTIRRLLSGTTSLVRSASSRLSLGMITNGVTPTVLLILSVTWVKRTVVTLVVLVLVSKIIFQAKRKIKYIEDISKKKKNRKQKEK